VRNAKVNSSAVARRFDSKC